MTKRHIVLACVIFSFLIAISWKWLYLKGEVPVNGNVIREVYPNWKITHDLLSRPSWPLWNPYRNMGEPHLADPKTMAAYPVSWALLPFSNFASFLQCWILFHSLLAMVFAAALTFRATKSPPAALTAAGLAGFNGFFMAHAPFPNLFASAAWIPGIFYFFYQKRWRPLGVCLALQWLAGYPPFSLLTGGALLVYWLIFREGSFLILARGSALATALAAFQWIPFVEFLKHSTRSLVLNPENTGQFSIPPKELLKELLQPLWIWTNPSLTGDPVVTSFYFGSLAVPLALWACWKGGRRERTLGVLTFLLFMLCFGSYLPGYRVLYFLHICRFPATWLVLAAFSLTMLTSLGVSKIANRKRAWIFSGAILADLLLFTQAPTAAWFPPPFLENPPPLLNEIVSKPFPTRLYHSPLMDAMWSQHKLETLADYQLPKNWMAPSAAVAWHGREANSYQVLRLARAQNYLDRLAKSGPSTPLLGWAGISTVVTMKPNANGLDENAIVALHLANAKPVVFLESGAAAGQVLRWAHESGRLRAEIEVVSATRLVFAEVDYPGWSARLDGQNTSHELFEETFMALRVPPGHHQVEWQYSPISFWIGLILSGLAWLGLGVDGLRRARH